MRATMVLWGLFFCLPAWGVQKQKLKTESREDYRAIHFIAPVNKALSQLSSRHLTTMTSLYRKFGQATVDKHLVTVYGDASRIEEALRKKEIKVLTKEVDVFEGLVNKYGEKLSAYSQQMLGLTDPNKVLGYAKDIWFDLYEASTGGAE